MNVRMNFEFLAPGMQHAEEANLCAEVSRMASDFEKGFGTGAEQEIVEDLLVLQNQWRQAAGECEDHVQVAGREQFSSTRSDPAFPCSGLTLRAVAIAAAVIPVGGPIPAAGDLIELPTECGGSAPPHRQQPLDVLPTEPLAIAFGQGVAHSPGPIRHP